MSDAHAYIGNLCCRALERVAKKLAPGVKLTLVVRVTGHNEADVMVGDDHPSEVIALIQRRVDETTAGRGVLV